MRWALSKEHRDYFQQNAYIEFDALLSQEQVSAASTLRRSLADASTFEEMFMNGRDLWRNHLEATKQVTAPKLAQLASELSLEKALRLGYAQYLSCLPQPLPPKNQALADWLAFPRAFGDILCLQGLACGLMLCLSSSQEPLPPPFPQTAGSGIFFSPRLSFSLAPLIERGTGEWLLITYTHPISLYLHKETDPQVHFLKNLGYVFGDRLKDPWNPLVFKS